MRRKKRLRASEQWNVYRLMVTSRRGHGDCRAGFRGTLVVPSSCRSTGAEHPVAKGATFPGPAEITRSLDRGVYGCRCASHHVTTLHQGGLHTDRQTLTIPVGSLQIEACLSNLALIRSAGHLL